MLNSELKLLLLYKWLYMLQGRVSGVRLETIKYLGTKCKVTDSEQYNEEEIVKPMHIGTYSQRGTQIM